MNQGLTKYFGNGKGIEALPELESHKFGHLLDRVAVGDITSDLDELRGIFREARDRGVSPRTYGQVNGSYLDALVRHNDSELRCQVVEFQWFNLTPENRDYLVNYGNTTVRQLIADSHVAGLNDEQLKTLLCAETTVALAAYTNAFSEDVRTALYHAEIVDMESMHPSFGNLVKADSKDFQNLRGTGIEAPTPEVRDLAIAGIIDSIGQSVAPAEVAR